MTEAEVKGAPALKYLFVGMPKSGTNTIAKTLVELGVCCGHEKIFHRRRKNAQWYNIVNWDKLAQRAHPERFEASVEYAAAPCLDIIPAEVETIHYVRNPLHCVRSLLISNLEGLYGRYVELPNAKGFAERVLRACKFYCLWAELLTGRCNTFFHVDNEQELVEILARVSSKSAAEVRKKMNSLGPQNVTPKRKEVHKATQLQWADLTTATRDWGREYGYVE